MVHKYSQIMLHDNLHYPASTGYKVTIKYHHMYDMYDHKMYTIVEYIVELWL